MPQLAKISSEDQVKLIRYDKKQPASSDAMDDKQTFLAKWWRF